MKMLSAFSTRHLDHEIHQSKNLFLKMTQDKDGKMLDFRVKSEGRKITFYFRI